MDSCERVFLRKPVIGNYEAMGNDRLTLAIELFSDDKRTVPYDFTGYTARGALKHGAGGAVTPLTSATIAGNLVTGLLSKATVESLEMNFAYIFDLSVDNGGTGDSFSLWTGTVVFWEGAST